MKIILMDDIPTLGRRGEVRDVSDGYARNFLLPQKLALHATPANMKNLAQIKARQDAQAARVDAERLVDPELHREVAHGAGKQSALLIEPARTRPVLVEGQDHVLVGAAELGIGEQPHPLLGLDVDEELDGVV